MLNIFNKHKKNKRIKEQITTVKNHLSFQITQFETMKAYTKYNDGYKHGAIDALNSAIAMVENILEEI